AYSGAAIHNCLPAPYKECTMDLRALSIFSAIALFSLAAPGAPLVASKHIAASPYPQEVSQQYTTDDGLPSNDVRALTITRDGNVYAATAKGLATWTGERWEPVFLNPGGLQLVIASGNQLYVAANNNIIASRTA